MYVNLDQLYRVIKIQEWEFKEPQEKLLHLNMNLPYCEHWSNIRI